MSSAAERPGSPAPRRPASRPGLRLDRRWLLAGIAAGLLLAAWGRRLRGTAENEPALFVLGDMAKPTGDAHLANDGDYLRDGVIHLHGAGDEVVAFQVVLRARQALRGLDARVAEFTSDPASSATTAIASEVFLEHYIRAEDASYSWGEGGAGALPWKGKLWPDALVPLRDPTAADAASGDPPSTVSLIAAPFAIDPTRHRNQALWIDVRIPRGQAAGRYTSRIDVLRAGRVVASRPIALQVHPFDLPAAALPDAYGELYRETGLMFDSGVKFKEDSAREWPIYRRYLQMAHAHGLLAMHRAENGPPPLTAAGQPAGPADRWSDWSRYTPYVAPLLTGKLFTEEQGYEGPWAGDPPAFFPAPFPEFFYGGKALAEHLDAHGGALDPALLERVRANAASFWGEVRRNGWERLPDGRARRFFAYMMDEVDGAQDVGAAAGNGADRAAQFHRAMADLQGALDAGTSPTRAIALLWTSHSDPAQWLNGPADLAPTIRWWSPNARACNPEFIARQRVRGAGQTFWFYHAGQPAVGNHAINQLGLDMRLWGLLCRRYPIDGAFMWSAMSFPFSWNEPGRNPYDAPIYRAGETRWGNGVLFYPGSRLPQAGYARGFAGPVASLRLKAWRRGLQDVAYCRLADARGHRAEVDALLARLIPQALGEAPAGDVRGTWSQRPADYEALRRQLATWIAVRE